MKTEIFTSLKKETGVQVLKAQRVSKKMNSNNPTLRNNIIKMAKIKGKERVNSKGSKRKTREPP